MTRAITSSSGSRTISFFSVVKVSTVSGVVSIVSITSDKCYRNQDWVWGYREDDELGGLQAGGLLVELGEPGALLAPSGRTLLARG